MPEGLRITERHEDPYAWALAQAAQLRRGSAGLKGLHRAGLSEFLEEWVEEALSSARSRLVNLMAHMAKVARSRNPAASCTATPTPPTRSPAPSAMRSSAR